MLNRRVFSPFIDRIMNPFNERKCTDLDLLKVPRSVYYLGLNLAFALGRQIEIPFAYRVWVGVKDIFFTHWFSQKVFQLLS